MQLFGKVSATTRGGLLNRSCGLLWLKAPWLHIFLHMPKLHSFTFSPYIANKPYFFTLEESCLCFTNTKADRHFGGLNYQQKPKMSEFSMLKQWYVLPYTCFFLLSSPPPFPLIQLAAIGGKRKWSSELALGAGGAGCVHTACLEGLWSWSSPGMQSAVLGTFPLLSPFNYGTVMKAARLAATYHTLTPFFPSNSHADPFFFWPMHSHLCCSFLLVFAHFRDY